ncbi:MAG TPA: DUF5009 domain-containing protein [Leptospiraceae bacterium]|nr:DUF5009 domain-containing protein [Leptospiraceae bacterium]HMW08446.1 DUF5009 domain-containing protein [Leptospiraceae bacterium]HMX34715.1 DUF5009 domain-containing protein [Leptospiraceae bacterium]HMY34273.1 DUF5009 domain-containing protein [Leptospiraceae bacterium]HMZ67071.1 DUF5009 domain-containing protein [Leptospiraceae bacterium]
MEQTNPKTRFLFLDVFRGITIFSMIIVNNPGNWGSIYAPLKHARWHGFGGADWIFPFFLFISGFAIPISFSKSLTSGKSRLALFIKILRRSLILFLLGIFLNGFPEFNFSTIRIPGVLQRIALVYLFSASLYLFLNRKILLYLASFLLILHYFLITQIPNPDLGEASLEMGKNLAGWIDLKLMPNHLWVFTKTWDPEGILGTIPAISSALFGIYHGTIFFDKKSFSESEYYLGIFSGLLLISLSFLWDIKFPINKNLWTGSFVLLNTGLALLFIHLLYDWIEAKQTKSWYKPFEILGVNAIGAFFLSSLFSKILNIPFLTQVNGKQVGLKVFLYSELFSKNFSSYNASLLWAICYTLIWILFFLILYKRKIFIRL